MQTWARANLLILVFMMGFTLIPSQTMAQTTEELIASLHSPLVKTRRDAARKLGERRDRTAVEPLIEALKSDEDEQVRQAAARSLGLLKAEPAIAELLTTLNEKSSLVREAAVVALVNYYIEHNVDFITARREGLQWINPFLETYEETAIEPHTEVDPRIIEGLMTAAAHDRDRHVKTAAIRSLGVLRATSVIDQLGDLMFSSSFMRVELLRTFTKLGERSAATYIIPFLNDGDPNVRYEALIAIGHLRSDAAVSELIKVYNATGEAKTKDLALQALALIGDPSAEEIFLSSLRTGKPESRRFAYEGVGRVGNREPVERISRDRLQTRHDVVKLGQAFALYKLGRQEYIEPIIQDLGTRRRQQAYGYLLEVNPEDLYPYLNRSTLLTRKWIVRALGRTGTEETIRKLEPLQQDPDIELIRAATLAIQRIKRRVEMNQGDIQKTRPRRTSP